MSSSQVTPVLRLITSLRVRLNATIRAVKRPDLWREFAYTPLIFTGACPFKTYGKTYRETHMRLKKALIYLLPLLAFVSASAVASTSSGNFGPNVGITENARDVREFYQLVLYIIAGIVVFVFGLMLYIMIRFREKANPVPSKTTHNAFIEVVWTVIPVLILLCLVAPSFNNTFKQDFIPETNLTIKVKAYTWHWQYEYVGMEDQMEEIISTPLSKEDADAAGKIYLLATSDPLVIPSGTKVDFLVTSDRNLHAFSMDQFWLKIDAIPDRINHAWTEVDLGAEGTYYGQCAELCGVNHYFMPIEIRVVSPANFEKFVASGGDISSLPPETNDLGLKTAALEK